MLLSLLSLLHSMFYGLPLALKPSISKWEHLFIYFLLFSTSPYHLRQFNLSFDSKGASFNRPNIIDRLTLSSIFIFSIQRNIGCSLGKRRCISSLRRGHHSIAWSNVPLKKLSYNFSHLAKEIVVDVKRGTSSWNFPYVALVLAIVASSQTPPRQISSLR